MDKSWIDIDRTDNRYDEGITCFLNFAFYGQPEGKKLRCPCNYCDNRLFRNKKEMYDHLIVHGFNTTYKRWSHHGESFFESNKEGGNCMHKLDAMQEMLHDLGRGYKINEGSEECVGSSPSNPNKEAADFYRLLGEAEQELYPNCPNFSKLSFIAELMNIKCLYGLSCKAMDAILDLIAKVLPKGNKVPPSYYEAKKIFENLGLKYEKIDACLNDCILYCGNYKDLDSCPICGACRWKNSEKQVIGKQVACKILRYFPLKDRVKRLYMSPKIASEMKWHKEKCPSDEYMRHPADSYAWKSFDSQHPSFATDPRNIRLGLASDGFNPFGNMSTSYSVWPIVLVNYNLPPWMCMKDPYFMLSMLIPGPKAPSNDIDVYLQPLIDELKDLWENGVETYDAASKSNFQLRVALMWTIGDYPGLAVLSGQSTKGKYACLICNDDTYSRWLPNGHKHCYMGHCRFLPSNHPWRDDAEAFDGKQEHQAAPKELTGEDIVERYKLFDQVTFGKSRKRKRGDEALPGCWRKKSIFFELSYWKTLMIRHNLDVMHIARNVFVSVFGTLMDVKGKTKDTIDTRFDLELMGIRPELYAEQVDENTFCYKTACHTLSSKEKKALCSFISAIKVPDGYSSNISRYVNGNGCNLAAMKCHDCHIFLQRFLPLAIRGVLKKEVCEPLIELSAFFRKLCAKKLCVEDMEMLDESIVLTLCKLEKVFPPSFFDVMIHLTIHLARQAIVAGPVTFRWMYFVERFLRRLKSYVRNKANPEGSIAELYIAQEAVTFCSLYLQDVETKLNRARRNYEGNDESVTHKFNIFNHVGRSLRGNKYERLSLIEWQQARSYVLRNCEDISHLMVLHKQEFEVKGKNNVRHQHDAEFEQWFKRYVFHLKYEGSEVYDEELGILACGPDQRVTKCASYLVNGWKFCTKDHDMKLKTQNSGVFVKGDEGTGHTDYFGVLTDIIELDYQGHTVVLFKCDWWDVSSKGCKEDQYGFTLVNVTRKLESSTNEPFVLATQAEQVYYVPDTKDPNWQVVIKTKPRDLYDFPPEEDAFGPCQEDEEIGVIQQENLFESEDGILSREELVEVNVEKGPINFEMVTEDEDEEDEVDYDDDLLSSDDEMMVRDEDIDDDL